MEKETIKQFRLGIFVVTGTILLTVAMYLIGRNQNLFGSTIHIVAYFNNVNGLQPGNNVRFSGTDAGTVESIEVMSDTSIRVEILLQEKYKTFIKLDANASIGTDGLMGNKLINIINVTNSAAEAVKDGSTILTLKPVETDEMLRTLNQTNIYVSGIAYNLKNLTDEIGNSRGTIWKLLTDTSLSGHVDSIFINFDQTSKKIADMAAQLDLVVKGVNSGNGLLGALVTDTTLSKRLYHIVGSLSTTSDQSAQVSADLLSFTRDIDKGKGTLGLLIRDSSVSNDLRTSVTNLKQSAESLNQSMEAIKKIPLLKKYLEGEKKKK